MFPDRPGKPGNRVYLRKAVNVRLLAKEPGGAPGRLAIGACDWGLTLSRTREEIIIILFEI